jgi:chromosome segregation ATPase
MGLRKSFLEHRANTIESFDLVGADISNINQNLAGFRGTLGSMDLKILELNSRIEQLGEIIKNMKGDMDLQNSTNASMASKIVDMNSLVNGKMKQLDESIARISGRIDSKIQSSVGKLNSRVSLSEKNISKKLKSSDEKFRKSSANSRKMSKMMTYANNTVKELSPRSKAQAAKARKLGSGIKESQEDIRKLKNIITRKLRSIRRAGEETESKLKSQKRRIQQLNRKMEGAAVGRKSSRRAAKRTSRKTPKLASRKTARKGITARKKITSAGKLSPKRKAANIKKVYEIIREKNPVI